LFFFFCCFVFACAEGGVLIVELVGFFLGGMTPVSVAATFSKGVVIPDYVFMAFQAVFATITFCLIIGSFA